MKKRNSGFRMKRMNMSKRLITTTLFLTVCLFLRAVPVFHSGNHYLELNKDLYVSGEKIFFMVTLSDQDSRSGKKIMYADLCDESKIVSSRILLRQNHHWQGDMDIPDSLQTGVYVFRVYSGNENGTPEGTLRLITVINPYGKNENNEKRKDMPGCQPWDVFNQIPSETGPAIKVYAAKADFRTGETIPVTLEIQPEATCPALSFRVYRIPDRENSHIAHPMKEALPAFSDDRSIQIYNSLTVSGRVVEKSTRTPVRGERLFFSIPDSIPQINVTHTDSFGIFHFSFGELFGAKDVIIQTDSKEPEWDIEIMPVFPDPPLRIPYYVAEEVEKSSFADQSLQRALIHRAYTPYTPETAHSTQQNVYPFYGATNEVVYPDRYVDLNDFEEITLELLPLCNIHKEKGVDRLRIYHPETKRYSDSPLILVDGVPVPSIRDLYGLSSPKVRRIEIQPDIRCFGSLLIEGALSVFTTRGNFLDVDLPPNAIRYTWDTFSLPIPYSGNQAPENPSHPDFRDVLYWEALPGPFPLTMQINVHASMEKGNYRIVAGGKDRDGRLYRSVFNFTLHE